MAIEITFDIAQFIKAIEKAPAAVARGAQTALGDIRDDWQAEAVDIAPMAVKNGGTLRQSIKGNVKDLTVEIKANAMRGGFNYAYYIHEDKGNAITGEKKFLDVSAEMNEDKWKKWLEEEIEDELKKVGWQ